MRKEKEAQIRTGIQSNTIKLMSEMEINFIKKYFHRAPSDHQILQMINKIMKGLKFFQRMSKKNREDIILASTVKVAKPGEYVIRQGEIGDHMYIILKGCINVKVNLIFKRDLTISDSKPEIVLRQVASLYDGDHFGEMALIDLEKKDDITEITPPKKRKAHCVAADTTILLEIPHAASIKAYQASSAKDMKERLDFLFQLPGFRMIGKNTLLPLVSNMKVKKYKIGEFLVRQREMPVGLIVLYKGECSVGYEKQRKREFHNNVYTKLKPKEMKIHFKNYSDTRYDVSSSFNSQIIKLKTNPSTTVNEIGEKVEELVTKRIFKNDILEKQEDPTGKQTIFYKDFINFCNIHRGQLFGFRTIMPLEVYILNKKKSDFENEFLQKGQKEEIQKFYNEACVSIVANSAVVEAFIFEKGLMSFLPEHLSNVFFKDLMTCQEFDRPANLVDVEKKESIIGSILRMDKEDNFWNS